jgi:hypothetical protein
MQRNIPAVRILPMSDKIEGFRDRTIQDVQARTFLRELPRCKGRFRYGSSGLSAAPGTVVLFQFKARIVASAMFLRDERYDKPKRGYGGAMYFDVKSIRTFDPLDAQAMRKVWPSFQRFGHVKQYLNPTCYPILKRRLKNLATP